MKKKSVVVTLRVAVTEAPQAGYATYKKGKLVFITGGAFQVEGRWSNHFTWRTIKTDGTLGRECSGYWK